MAAARCLRDRRCDSVSVGLTTHHTTVVFPLYLEIRRPALSHINFLRTIGQAITCTSIG